MSKLPRCQLSSTRFADVPLSMAMWHAFHWKSRLLWKNRLFYANPTTFTSSTAAKPKTRWCWSHCMKPEPSSRFPSTRTAGWLAPTPLMWLASKAKPLFALRSAKKPFAPQKLAFKGPSAIGSAQRTTTTRSWRDSPDAWEDALCTWCHSRWAQLAPHSARSELSSQILST